MKDRYEVAVVNNEDIVVGHLPKSISMACLLFISQGGVHKCEVTEDRRYSSDLPQGGLQTPCRLLIEADQVKEVKKLLRTFDHGLNALQCMYNDHKI